MHRMLLNAPRHLIVGHIDNNGLNNRRSNLRLCTYAEKNRNKRPNLGSTSRYKGVSWNKIHNVYQAHIGHNGNSIKIGIFKKAFELFSRLASLNFPKDYGLPRRRSGVKVRQGGRNVGFWLVPLSPVGYTGIIFGVYPVCEQRAKNLNYPQRVDILWMNKRKG